MAERVKNMRQLLIEAGIEEINRVGVAELSVRRVAQACGGSCAAPYKHFKDRRDFVSAIIEYVNEQWYERQEEILSACTGGLRERIVENSVGYVQFLVEKPWFRSILMLKNEEFDNLYHKPRGQKSSRTQRLEAELYATSGWDLDKLKRKIHIVRAMMFGTVLLIEMGELTSLEQVMETVRNVIDREFDLP